MELKLQLDRAKHRQEAQESGNSYRAAACWDHGASAIWAASDHFGGGWWKLGLKLEFGSLGPLPKNRIK